MLDARTRLIDFSCCGFYGTPQCRRRTSRCCRWSKSDAHLLVVLEACEWNRARAAKVLGVDRKTVYRMMARFGLAALEPNG